jgi:hypothetical protein
VLNIRGKALKPIAIPVAQGVRRVQIVAFGQEG